MDEHGRAGEPQRPRGEVAGAGEGAGRSATGACARCRRALDLASVEVDGRWYGRAECVLGGACPLDESAPAVPEPALINRPRRFFRQRAPKELRQG